MQVFPGRWLPLYPLQLLFYHFHHFRVYLINILIAIYLDQLMLVAIIIEQVNGLVKKDIQPPLYSFSCIIRALVQFTSIYITYPRYLWRVRVYIINVLVGTADKPPRQPAEQFLARNLQVDCQVYLFPGLL